MKKSVVIIGAGFAGLSAAAFTARAGWKVTVLEKNSTAGGRARQFRGKGFTFDAGPSWYWMPDVFERFFQQFGHQVSDFYSLKRLDPSYRVFWSDGPVDIPARYEDLCALFESLEPGSAARLGTYLEEARLKYDIGIRDLVYKPGRSLTEFLDWRVVKNVMRLDVFTSMKAHISRHFKNEKLRQLMEFPVLFLGALPENTPALYSLMNYADIVGGTWYPEGGLFSVVQAMQRVAEEQGAEFRFNEPVEALDVEGGSVRRIRTGSGTYTADAVISGADYHHTESTLLPEGDRSYSEGYWDSRVLAPSCLLYYIGLKGKLNGVLHHNLFFDVPFERHAAEIYTRPSWPDEPLFYLNVPSKTDSAAAPEGDENLMVLIPVAAGLKGDDEALRARYLNTVLDRLQKHTGEDIRGRIVYQRSFSVSDFISDFHSYKGNAYGLANILKQTALLRPSCHSKKVSNLFYTGQLTVPGPGVPPSLISGEVVAREVFKQFKTQPYDGSTI